MLSPSSRTRSDKRLAVFSGVRAGGSLELLLAMLCVLDIFKLTSYLALAYVGAECN
jgi:hypothetical protein